MKRRAAIRDLLIMAGGITMLPSCLNSSGKASLALNNIQISAEQERLMAEIAETIIPETDTPGAKEVGSHLFVLKMVDDCYAKEDQEKFVAGLNELNKRTKKRFQNSFVDCTDEQRAQMLLSIENKEDFPPEVFDFYTIMKQRTLQGYLTSKYVLTNITKYEMIPSVPYNGYYPLKNITKNGRQS
jgi:gluconate 2-dehydrogenase subunit 3-like protein